MKTSLVLIGMPAAGKSTVGVLVSKFTGLGFVDTDVVLQQREGRLLQQILDTDGYLALRQAEEAAILSCPVDRTVVATGGSAVYSDKAMAYLKERALVVFLRASLPLLRTRLADEATRGIARAPGQSFEDLFAEREALYLRWADAEVSAENTTPDLLARQISAIFSR